MARNGGNKLNKGFIGVNKFSSSTEGIKNPRNDYLNKVVNATDVSNLSPSFSLDFTGPTWQNQVVFSRGTTASFLGSSGYITLAGPNVPRIQYGLSGNTLGLLIEPSVGVRWSLNNVSITAWISSGILGTTAYDNVAFAPNGTTTAMWVVPTTANSANHFITGGGGLAASYLDSYLTTSMFLKKAEYTAAVISMNRTAAPFFTYSAYIDLTNGNIYKEDTSDNYGYTVVEPYINDWWKVTLSTKAFSAGNYVATLRVLPNSTFTNITTAYAGTGTSGIYMWGSNYHAVGGPVEYLNQNGFVAKAADLCYVIGNSFSNWYTYPGCFYMEYYNKPNKFNISTFDSNAPSSTAVASSSTTILASPYQEKKTFFISNGDMIGNKTAFFECLEDYILSNNGKTGYQELNKMVFAISGTTFPYTLRFSLNGSNVQKLITSNFDPQGITCMLFGSRGFLVSGGTVPTGVAQYNGILKQFNFYNTDLTDDQLRSLTT